MQELRRRLNVRAAEDGVSVTELVEGVISMGGLAALMERGEGQTAKIAALSALVGAQLQIVCSLTGEVLHTFGQKESGLAEES